jgi:hypothetical protein
MIDENGWLPKMPEGGNGKLRALLASLKEDTSQLENHPIYKEGYSDGLQTATKRYKEILKAVSAVYSANDKMFE